MARHHSTQTDRLATAEGPPSLVALYRESAPSMEAFKRLVCHIRGNSVGLGCDGAGPWDVMAPCIAESTPRHAITALKPTAYRLGVTVTRCSLP
eukprot:4763525-Prymnesium_polylepis.2